MIVQGKVREVERLLAGGSLSQRKIAKMVGISRAVVGAIAAGERPDYEAIRQARQEDNPEPLGPLGRCPGCGGLVYSPCRLCGVRMIKDRERRLVRESRRKAHQQSLQQLLHRLREQSLRGDGPRSSRRLAG